MRLHVHIRVQHRHTDLRSLASRYFAQRLQQNGVPRTMTAAGRVGERSKEKQREISPPRYIGRSRSRELSTETNLFTYLRLITRIRSSLHSSSRCIDWKFESGHTYRGYAARSRLLLSSVRRLARNMQTVLELLKMYMHTCAGVWCRCLFKSCCIARVDLCNTKQLSREIPDLRGIF